jgi:hypothetical protein
VSDLLEAASDLAAAVDAVCDADSLALAGEQLLPDHARTVLELSLQRFRVAQAEDAAGDGAA